MVILILKIIVLINSLINLITIRPLCFTTPDILSIFMKTSSSYSKLLLFVTRYFYLLPFPIPDPYSNLTWDGFLITTIFFIIHVLSFETLDTKFVSFVM